MPGSCFFLFHDSLNDFLPKRKKAQWIPYTFKTPASAKDAIEAIGVPHVEVMKIEIYGAEKSIHYLLQPADHVAVFPFPDKAPQLVATAFVLDVHLGKLARLLRLMGIDVFYRNDLSDRELVAIAVAQKRAVLTRDIGLLKHKVLDLGYWLRSQQSEEQLLEILQRFSLCPHLQPFSRCTMCNGKLQPVAKEEVRRQLPEKTSQFIHEFYWCNGCGKVYWKGSHFEKMQSLVRRVRSLACP